MINKRLVFILWQLTPDRLHDGHHTVGSRDDAVEGEVRHFPHCGGDCQGAGEGTQRHTPDYGLQAAKWDATWPTISSTFLKSSTFSKQQVHFSWYCHPWPTIIHSRPWMAVSGKMNLMFRKSWPLEKWANVILKSLWNNNLVILFFQSAIEVIRINCNK